MSWIKCSERLPEVSRRVLLRVAHVTSGATVQVGWLRDLRYHTMKNVSPWQGEDRMLPQHLVTHWRPLPEPPKDGE